MMFGIRGTTQLAQKSEPLDLRNVKYIELRYYYLNSALAELI